MERFASPVKEFSGKIWRRGRFEAGTLVTENGKIREIKATHKAPYGYILPPFADPHIHGGWGKIFIRVNSLSWRTS